MVHDASRQNSSLGVLKNSFENHYYDNELSEDIAQWRLASKILQNESVKIGGCVKYVYHLELFVKIIKVADK